jgi:hypothetical protein
MEQIAYAPVFRASCFSEMEENFGPPKYVTSKRRSKQPAIQ